MSTLKAERYCIRCARPRRADEYACPDCGADVYTSTVSGDAEPMPASGELLAGVLDGVELPGGHVGLIYGRRGTGKTTVALQALGRPPRDGDRVAPWFCSSELVPAMVLSYAKRCGVRVAEVSAPELGEDGAMRLGLPARPVPAILDSLTRCADGPAAFEGLRAHARRYGVQALALVQVTKDGDPRGPATYEHDADLVIELRAGQTYRSAIIHKNRFGPERSIVWTMTAKGAARPRWDRYYSIEGHGPDYEIRAFPPGGIFADPYRYKPPAPLPPPPIAVAAQRSELYAGGWIEPADLDAREAFAAAAGLPFHRVTENSADV